MYGRHAVGDIRTLAYTIIMNTNKAEVWIRDLRSNHCRSTKFHTLKTFQKLVCAICIQLFLGRWNIHWSKAKHFGTLMRTDTRNHLTRDTASDSSSPSLQNVPFGNSKILQMGCEWTRNISFCIWLEIFRTVQICILVFRVTSYYPVSGFFNDLDENDAASILGNP